MEVYGNHTGGASGGVSIDNLYPAILQCFLVILFGYIAGRINLISHSHKDGIGTFVAYFCLPALLFKSMCELKFDEVDWMFLLAILISKTTVFVAVFLLTVLAKRPFNFGYAGLFAIFATQSNDFALGYPILQALYENSHPDYLKYIYLIAPISLAFLNPIGFTFLEIQKRRGEERTHSSKLLIVYTVIKGVFTNPIVFMTLIGVAGNFIFKQSVPKVLDGILTVLGNAFSASALFYLGLNLVGKVQAQLGVALLVPVLLIIAKTLILPFVTWEVVDMLEWSSTSFNASQSLSMFGFLYGTFPTAPSVFLYASQYSIATDIMASGMVMCTFLSAPLMFVSAKMMTVGVSSELDYKNLLLNTSFDVCIISLVCCVWVFGIFILNKKWRKLPHQFTLCLVVSQFIACVGMLIYDGLDSSSKWQHYVQFVILILGVLSSRCWTAMLALSVYLIDGKSLCYVLRVRFWMFLFGFGVPMFSTGILLLAGSDHLKNEVDPSFHYGNDQTILSAVIIIVCLTITITCVILHQRHGKMGKHRGYSSLESSPSRENVTDSENCNGNAATNESPSKMQGSGRNSPSIEDIVPFAKKNYSAIEENSENPIKKILNSKTCADGSCSRKQRRACARRIQDFTGNIKDDDDEEIGIVQPKNAADDDYQIGRHLVLLLLLSLSLFIGGFLCIWRIFNKGYSGIYIEVEFLDGVFNYGQGLMTFAVFGFDVELIVGPILRRWRKLFYGTEVVVLPKESELSEECRRICSQFRTYHIENCKKEIVNDRWYKLKLYKNVFTGCDLVDWLEKVGLAENRQDATLYGGQLLMGRVIKHVTNERNFYDLPDYYKFIHTEISRENSIADFT